jgi:drug/metabolite transporter (DMT)-like permease
MTSKRKAYFFVIFAAILWGTIGIYSKHLTNLGFAPIQIVFIRAAVASAAMILFALLKNPKLVVIQPRHLIYFIGTGIFSFAFFNWCYFTAINLTSLSVAAVLLYTAPTIVTIFSVILFKEKLTPKKILSLVLTFVGCVFVAAFVDGAGRQITLPGILAGLGAGFGYALYSIFGRIALAKYDTITVTLYTFIFASLGLIGVTDIPAMKDLLRHETAVLTALALGLFATVLPFLFYTIGLSHLETSKASIIATLEPIVATAVGAAFFNELLTGYKVFGISLVVIAVAILSEKGTE